ncbi:MAG: RICIN domain-containing protein, partial [Ruminococcus sp.]|nr:RICIN domain-containing protein [Ruminococcus sp.]
TWLIPLFSQSVSPINVKAISTDYPVQLMNISAKDNKTVLTENGTADGSAVPMQALGNNLSGSWRFDRVNQDTNGTFFKICNAESGRLLTPANYSVKSGTGVIVYGSESHQSQHWYVVPVKNDHLGNNLYYKIVNYSDTSLALTQGKSGASLEKYTGADNQLWLLNPDGLQGFAGYCDNDNTGNIKAGNIGGLFGETVEVSTFNDLKKYAESDTPYTIVVTKNISVTELNMNGTRYMCTAGRIYVRNNKTIIGSYNAHTLFNVQFCTSSSKGVGNNIIIKNFEMQHDAESNNNDSIVCYFGSGKNIWVDHVTFIGHENYGYAPKTKEKDEDKFLACCYDADYCTVSDCSFGKHKYGLILGYPADDAGNKAKYGGYPRMSLISNKFDGCETRGPGLMRWGYFHSLNNYVNNFSMAYTVMSDVNIYAENCNYENGGNVICDWDKATYIGHYSESGSVFSGCKRTQQGGDSNSTADASKWRPTGNYSYIKLTANEAKTYCSVNSGCQTSNGGMMYLRFAKKGVPSAGFTSTPSGEMTTAPTTKPTTKQTTTTTTTTKQTTTTTTTTAPVVANFNDGSAYRIKNADSGLYMQVANANAENGANVQQWGSDGKSVHDMWKMFSAGDGYYYIASCVGDGGTYVLDVAGKKTDNGTNIDIYKYNGGTNQQFMLTKNDDGSYKIRTRVSGGKSVVEVANADKNSGANIQEWEINNANCQNWILEPVTDAGCVMDESVVYTFENVNSGMLMEVTNGTMADNTNVQQWGANGYDCQKWILKSFGSGNYYWIRSAQDESYALKADGSSNGGNICLTTYSTKDSSQLFRFTKNLDGSYSIITHASKDKCLVEVASASKESGANVQQWEITNSSCQKWNISTEKKPVATTQSTTKSTTTKNTTTTTTTTTTTKPVDKEVSGDLNDDGNLNVTDLVLLEKWLLSADSTGIVNWKSADFNSDNILDVFDLCMMRKNLVR